MIFKYNKGIVIHLFLSLVAYYVLVKIYGIMPGTLIIVVFLILSSFMFNCYRVDISNSGIVIYKVYDGKSEILWDEIKEITVANPKIEMPVIGMVRNMKIKTKNNNEYVVNIEPVIRDSLIEKIIGACNSKGILLDIDVEQ